MRALLALSLSLSLCVCTAAAARPSGEAHAALVALEHDAEKLAAAGKPATPTQLGGVAWHMVAASQPPPVIRRLRVLALQLEELDHKQATFDLERWNYDSLRRALAPGRALAGFGWVCYDIVSEFWAMVTSKAATAGLFVAGLIFPHPRARPLLESLPLMR